MALAITVLFVNHEHKKMRACDSQLLIGFHVFTDIELEERTLLLSVEDYRVTIHIVPNLPLTSKQKFRFSMWPMD